LIFIPAGEFMTFESIVQGVQKGINHSIGRHPKNRETMFKHHSLFTKISRAPTEEVLSLLLTFFGGLTPEDLEARLEQYGRNEISHERYNWQKQFLKVALNPFIVLLAVLATVSYFTGDIRAAIVMAAMAIISVTLTFVQEFRSSKAAEQLKAMVSTNCTVIRQILFTTDASETEEEKSELVSTRMEIPMSDLVPGDIISLSAGDMIPADVRLLTSKDLFISQSQLTGESIPVEKFSREDPSVFDDGLLERRNLCFMGSNVVSGTALAAVIRTGADTYVGSIASKLAGQRVQTSFDKGIHRFTWLMIKFMMVMVPLVFLINGFSKGNWSDAFLFAVAVAVGLTPEMLPMIVTVNLAKGAMAMAKKKVIVKRLNSIQNFGAMDILCTDKTGTLTQDKVLLEKYVDALGDENLRVLKYAFLNSFYQTGLKNLLDFAILKHVEVKGELAIEKNYRKVDEIPFDFNRKRMSVVVEKMQGTQSRHILICKGALEEIFNLCSHAEIGREKLPINEVPTDQVYKIAQDMNDDGLRVIAVAYKEVPPNRSDYSVRDESGLTLLGYVAFLDPPKESAAQAILALDRYGVKVKVLTGDNDRVTRKICKEVGLNVDNLMLGNEVEAMTDDELDQAVKVVTVFAKLTPAQKERIVHSLHRNGHVVGFMGDGINDAPALRAADVGISVDNAVDVAKESADIILLEKSLLVLEEGVIEGRKVFGNIIKYIKMGASSNFGNVFSVLGASAFLPFLPMQPVQLLTQNLLYDLSQTGIPLDNVDKEYLERPRKWEIGDIGRFMLVIGPISSIFDYATFALMWFVFKANNPGAAGLFQSGWFIEGLLSQTLIVHMIRTPKIPFIQSRASGPLLFMTGLIMAIGIYVPFSPYGASIGLQPLPLSYFPWLIGMLLGYCFLTQVVKNWFIKKFGYN
jgi:Mg2+-importing ATPase